MNEVWVCAATMRSLRWWPYLLARFLSLNQQLEGGQQEAMRQEPLRHLPPMGGLMCAQACVLQCCIRPGGAYLKACCRTQVPFSVQCHALTDLL